MCHHNTILLNGWIHEANQKKWYIITHASILTNLIVSVLFGLAGCITITAYSHGDLLENYCWNDDLMNLSHVLFSSTILLTFPIECFVTREVLEHSLFPRDEKNVPMSVKFHYTSTLTIIAVTYLIPISKDCLGVVLELNVSFLEAFLALSSNSLLCEQGVLAAVPLAYVLPALCYLKLEEGTSFQRGNFQPSAWQFLD